MSVRVADSALTFASLRESLRAVIFLRVDWSCPERVSRQAFRNAANRLTENQPSLGVELFMADEEAEACREWLASFRPEKIAYLGGGYPLGAGSILWLERGRLVRVDRCGPAADEIIERSLALWGHKPLS